MPYGVYTVHQTSGWEGREMMKDFDVFIAQNGQTYRYLINNANFESYMPSTKISRFQQQNKRFGKIFQQGGDTDVQCSAFRGHTIRIFAVKGGRPAVLRRQGENMKKNIGKIQVLK